MKIFVCMSIMTGNGSKYIATNLANAMKKKEPKKNICLVDFNFRYPYLAERLALHDSVHGIDNLIDKIDGNFLEEHLFKENMIPLKNGIDLLKGTKMSYDSKLITREHIEKIMELLKSNYDYIFIATYNQAILGTVLSLFEADHIILVGQNNYSSFREAKRAFRLVDNYKGNQADLHLIINQYNERSEVDFSEYVTEYHVKDVELVPFQEETFDHKDLDKNLIFSKIFKSKKKDVFDILIDKYE